MPIFKDRAAISASEDKVEAALRDYALECWPELVPSGNPNYDAGLGAATFLITSAHGDNDCIQKLLMPLLEVYQYQARRNG